IQKLSVLRYCFSETHRFLSTSSRCMMAICPAGPPEVDETKLHPKPESLPEAHRLGLPGTVLRNGLSIHSSSTTLVNNTDRRRVTTVTRDVKPFGMMCYR